VFIVVNKKELIEKYKDREDYLAIASMLQIILYEVNFEKDYVFGATVMHGGKKAYFLRALEVDDKNYIYFSLHNHRHYRKDFQYLHEKPIVPEGHKGKSKYF
jgi:hypothetical protein